MDLSYKSYRTIYCVNNKHYPLDPDLQNHRYVCFANAFPWNGIVDRNRFFRIFIYKEDGCSEYNHYCPFTCKQVYNHIKLARYEDIQLSLIHSYCLP